MGVLYGESRKKESPLFSFFFFQSIYFQNFVELTSRQSDTVSLVIDETSDLVEIAVPLHSVLDRGGFHEESVISFLQDSIDTLVVGLGEHARPRFLHGRPHALIGRIIGILENDYFFVTINNSRFSNQLEHRGKNHPEESGCGSTSHGSVLDFCLLSEIFDTFNRIVHLVDREEGGQVGGVRGDHNQGEKPPHTGHHSNGRRSKFESNKINNF